MLVNIIFPFSSHVGQSTILKTSQLADKKSEKKFKKSIAQPSLSLTVLESKHKFLAPKNCFKTCYRKSPMSSFSNKNDLTYNPPWELLGNMG